MIISQTMKVTKVRNLFGLGAVAATAAGACFNHNYYYYGYQGDRIWKVGQDHQPSAQKEVEVKKEYNEIESGKLDGSSVNINKSEETS